MLNDEELSNVCSQGSQNFVDEVVHAIESDASRRNPAVINQLKPEAPVFSIKPMAEPARPVMAPAPDYGENSKGEPSATQQSCEPVDPMPSKDEGSFHKDKTLMKEPVTKESDKKECQIPEVPMALLLSKFVDSQREAALPSSEIDPFSGADVLSYMTFMKNFGYVVEGKTNDPARRLELLLKYTKGEAHELIKECPMIETPSQAYERAKQLLKRDYGQPSILAAAYKNKAEQWGKIATGDKTGLRKFSIFLINCCNGKQSNRDMASMDGFEFLKLLAGKLPVALQQQWIRQVGKFREIEERSPTLEDFERFVGQISRNENDPRIAGLGYQRRNEEDKKQLYKSTRHESRGVTQRKAFAATVKERRDAPKHISKENKAAKAPCLHCGDGTNHCVLDCRKFASLDAKAKSEFCHKRGMCFGCLNPGHMKKTCPNPDWAKCSLCSRRHVTCMHDPDRQPATPKNEQKEPETAKVTTGCVSVEAKACGATNTDKTNPLMAIVPVTIKAKSSTECITTYAFIENGCGAVFSTKELNRQLKTKSRKTKLIIKTMNSEELINTEVILDELQLSSIDGDTFIDLPAVFMKDSMPVTMKEAPTQRDLNEWSHLKQIKLPDQRNIDIPKVSLMIGVNVPAASLPLETAAGHLGDPYAIRSPLGWLVYGLPGKLRDQPEVSVNINMDFNERLNDDKQAMSVEDRQFITFMDESVVKTSGHYQMKLPFRDCKVCMPDNRSQAGMFAARLNKKLSKDDRLKTQYTDFMTDLERKGFAERVPLPEIKRDDGRVWYIPHHGVYHPRKPDKLRVVFNCPVDYKGTSLNSQLLQGPDMTNHMYGVLLRWRQENVAIMADIEAMFYQVRVTPGDCDMLRYLWWPEGDLQREPEVYRMLVHLFGAVSSPSCANYALKKKATDNEHKYRREVIEAIHNDFYVDDFVKSVATEDEGISLAQDMKRAVAEGGFKLTKWTSNSRKLLATIPKEDLAKEVRNLDLQTDELPVERALGVQWCIEDDRLQFSQEKVNPKPTRRNILSVMSSIFDPFGATSPFVLRAKMILQSLCRNKIGWDDPIPTKEKQEWENWLKDLPNLSRVQLNRCFKPVNFGKVANVQMHHFTDASQQGYGTVTYLRLTNENRETHCEFVCAKARVAPLKTHTIVKMELTAATSAVRQDDLLKRELTVNIDQTVFWTDSQTVLKYIMNETTRFPVFVANRIAVIRDASDISQWRYVPTKLNPADHASRGLSAEDLINKPEWLGGPNFLSQPEESWPGAEQIQMEDDEENDNCEVADGASQVNINVVMTSNETSAIDQLIHHYSDWTKLKRAIAWWLRLKTMLQHRKTNCNKKPLQNKPLTVEEMQCAEKAILKYVQGCAFPREVEALKNVKTSDQNPDNPLAAGKEATPIEHQRKPINKGSPLISLDPELRDGLLTVGGRLRHASIPEAAKHQLILPKDHHISTLVIRHIHQRSGHQGRNHILGELRQRYWILEAGVAVRSLIHQCVICRKYQAGPGKQRMADLPAYRVRPDAPPFTYTGVDYFGPFDIKYGRVIRKRYGVVFTCLTSRAIHIEVADSLDTSSCISALRRFMARRGKVKEIHPDNGSNFVGADKELQRAMQEWNHGEINNFALKHDIKWQFNTPAASHHGRVWERKIRTIRKILHAILSEQYMKTCQSEEQLRNFMCEVEAVINSRPLTRAPDDPHDLSVITPNSLILLKPDSTLPPGVFSQEDQYSRRRWRQMQYMADVFWKRWTREYLPTLQQRQKWSQPSRNIEKGDVVLIVDNSAPRNSWPMGLVQEVFMDKRGHVRSVKVMTKTSVLVRPITKLCLLLEQDVE
ncbi:uncharacterized protein LOC119741653 [Patiria miniata]|uniref:Uncharacterized protein n=1 Tax=Patiria miniata TaxID=46514 RepID=A0A914BDB6_PATMI|nr:uncharacterized protein LOC119741653 [Patiria miniata]